jgi:hypothetical protein
MPKIISIEIINMTIDPATAKLPTSKPKRFKIVWPMKRKAIINKAEIKVAFSAYILPSLFLIWIIKGIEPTMSITENKINVTEKESLIFIFLV